MGVGLLAGSYTGKPNSRDRLIDELWSGEPRLCRECDGRYFYPKVVDGGDERLVLRCPLCDVQLGLLDGDKLVHLS